MKTHRILLCSESDAESVTYGTPVKNAKLVVAAKKVEVRDGQYICCNTC